MLCTTCQNQPRCVVAQLAASDAALHHLLDKLQRCGLWRRRSPWQRLWHHLWQSLWQRPWAFLRSLFLPG